MQTVELHKPAPVDVPLLEPIRIRWSPRAFSPRPISDADLRTILVAGQWAPSTYNEQEWRYIVTRAQDAEPFARALACLVPKNQQWARLAPVLLLSCGRPTFTRTGKPNPVWQHDVGLASAQIVIQAMSIGIYAHQMSGIQPEVIRATYHLPDEFEPVAAMALGYPGDVDALPEDFRAAESAERGRRPLHETFFSDDWGLPAAAVR